MEAVTAASRPRGRAEREAALGTAASGLTPPPAVCTCATCGGNPAGRTAHRPQEGTAA